MRKYLILGLIVVIIGGFLLWLFIESSKPLPGQKIADLGRSHVQIGTKLDYNSNPPTSGPHYGEWIRAGVYGEPKDDRNLVHSLEHGYVIMHYKCDLSQTVATPSASLRSDNKEQCETRQKQLAQIYEEKGKRKLIVLPRSNLDTNFALTAWTYIDKFDQFDQVRIEKFIDTHLNQGPEKTME